MTHFTAVWTWTLFRSLVLILIALPFCGLVVRWFRSTRDWRSAVQWSLLIVPVLFPELLTGYAYGQMTRLQLTGPWIRELWFDLLLFLRVVPIGTLLWYWAPPTSISREAIHLRILAFRTTDSPIRRFLTSLFYRVRGPGRAALFAGSGLFLWLFQEFELASLLAVKSWTVWLFDAQAEGLPLSESLTAVAFPAFASWVIGFWCTLSLAGSRTQIVADSSRPPVLPLFLQVGLWIYLVGAAFLIGLYPFILIGLESLQGFAILIGNTLQFRGLMEGILVAMGSAIIATILTDLVAEILVIRIRKWWSGIALLVASFGLVGSLAVALSMIAVFQLPVLLPLRETSAPVIVGLMIWLLPRAIVMQGIRQFLRSPMSEHAAELLKTASDGKRQRASNHLNWLIRGRSQFGIRCLLFHWAYWELSLPHLLNPAGLVPAPVRLYGDAHFARNAVLTAKAGVILFVPVMTLIVIWMLVQAWESMRSRPTSASRSRHPH